MLNSYLSTKNILIIDFIILTYCILGIYQVFVKADLSFGITTSETSLIISNSSGLSSQMHSGDKIISIDGNEMRSREEVELYLDGKIIDDKVLINYEHKGKIAEEWVKLVAFYSTFYNFIAVIVGLSFFLAGIFVLVKCSELKTGHAFHWCMIATTMIIMMTWGSFKIPSTEAGIATRTGFHFGYAFIPSLFLHFALVFPSEKK